MLLLDHEALENDVSVDTRDTRPSTTGPGITARGVGIHHAECVLTVWGCGQAVLVGTKLVVGETLAGDQYLRTIENHVGLLCSIGGALLRHGDVDLALLAGDCAHRNGY